MQSRSFGKTVLFSAVVVLSMAGPLVSGAWAQCTKSCAGLPGIGPVSPFPRSFQEFISNAYWGAYNREPSCFELQNEHNRLKNAQASGTLLAEAKRFVATLFMTQTSYNVQDLITYRQTTEYQARNPQENKDRLSIERFVTDLYWAFLQRQPDQAGLCFWSNNVCQEGRKKGIRAFEVSIEFGDLVKGLYDDGVFCSIDPPPPTCEPGMICQ